MGDEGMHMYITGYSGPGKHFRSMEDFMNSGAIRISTEHSPLMELRVPPTKAQMSVIYDWVDCVKWSEDFIILSMDEGEYKDVDPENASKVIGLIRNRFGSTLEESSGSGTVDWDSVKEFFGTLEPDELCYAYYILPDGSFLDLEKRNGETAEFDYPPEHDYISKYRDSDGNQPFRNREDAKSKGAIRVMASSDQYACVDIESKPTEAQLDALSEFIEYN